MTTSPQPLWNAKDFPQATSWNLILWSLLGYAILFGLMIVGYTFDLDVDPTRRGRAATLFLAMAVLPWSAITFFLTLNLYTGFFNILKQLRTRVLHPKWGTQFVKLLASPALALFNFFVFTNMDEEWFQNRAGSAAIGFFIFLVLACGTLFANYRSKLKAQE